MVQLQTSLKEVEAAGGSVVAVSYDSPEILKRFAGNRGVTLPLLSDAGSRTIDAYGIRNREAPARWNGIPYPGTFIIDQQGIIRAKLFFEGYKDRHEPEALIRALKEAR